jgi:hypothetical protein
MGSLCTVNICQCMCSLAHSLMPTRLYTHAHTHSLLHSLTHTHSCIHSLMHSLVHSLTHSPVPAHVNYSIGTFFTTSALTFLCSAELKSSCSSFAVWGSIWRANVTAILVAPAWRLFAATRDRRMRDADRMLDITLSNNWFNMFWQTSYHHHYRANCNHWINE